MVVLNLTFFIELGLFLIFLWLANRLIFQPILRTMDERDSRVSENREKAREQHQHAEELTAQYSNELFKTRRAATKAVDEARQTALEERSAAILERRRGLDAEVAKIRSEGKRQLKTESQAIEDAAADLEHTLADCVTPKGVRP